MNPFLVLGVQRGAGDAEIRQAYLDAVKQAPPESDPERFASLNRAYEAIKDEKSRIRHALFGQDCPGNSPLDALVRHGRLQGPPRPPAFETMKYFLRKCGER
jgi:curved DNA-binding protein CbpA